MAFKTVFPLLKMARTLQEVCKAVFDLNKQMSTYWGGLVNDFPIISGKPCVGNLVGASPWMTKVYHKLGRVPVGGIVYANNSTKAVNITLYRSDQYAPTDTYFYVYCEHTTAGSPIYIWIW